MAGREVIKVLCNRFGFTLIGIHGSHAKLRSGSRTTIVPLHDELRTGTLRGVLRLAGVDWEVFQRSR